MTTNAFPGRTILRGNEKVNQVACPNKDGWIDLSALQYLGKEPLRHERCGYEETVNFAQGLVIET